MKHKAVRRMIAMTSSLATICACQNATTTSGPIPRDGQVEEAIRQHLRDMSLEEKIGQMTQINVTEIMGEDYHLDPQKAEKYISHYKVGSFLNTPYAYAPGTGDFAKVMKQIQEWSLREIGIPCLFGLDQIHGATYTAGATFFPQEINLAATFNREHARNMGRVNAYETRASNVAWTFAPVMDLGRNPIWPRMWESFGEDCLVNAAMGKAEVEGLQGPDPAHIGSEHIAACLKHYMAYGAPVSGQDRTPSSITRREMREKYFEPFRTCIQAGALSIMVNSASNDGMPFHCNQEYLTQWLKEDLNWDGVIVTDWNDIWNLCTRERVAETKKDAVQMAVNAGIDLSMVPLDAEFGDLLKELVEEGGVPMTRIDDAVSRVLRMKYRLGLFDRPVWDEKAYDRFNCDEFEEMAYQAAVESEILLKNEHGMLPLSPATRILVTGPNAHSMRTLNGAWSYSWQGDKASDPHFTGKYHTIYDALKTRFENVEYVPGVWYDLKGSDWKKETVDIPEAVKAAQRADVIVACIGENSYCETPGNDTDLNLSGNQKNLVKELAATGKPLVLILNEGRPRIIREIEPLADAIVDILLPSNRGADALAALLCGEENFSGKLPFTYPKYANKWGTYDYKPSEQTNGQMEGLYNYDAVMDVQWKFGHGLSYTTFRYSNLQVEEKEFTADDVLHISVDVENTGAREGMESILLFTSDLYASTIPDVRRLRDFTKIALEPGEKKTVVFELPARDLAFVSYQHRWTLEKGEFLITVGDQQEKIRCTETRIWETPNKD